MLLTALTLVTASQGWASIDGDLDRLINTLPEGHIHSIKVIEAQTGKVLFERNGDYNLLPASTVKTITAISAYHALGKNYRYTTALLSNRPISNAQKIYTGDLVLTFSGDPSLKRYDLAKLLASLRDNSIEVIKGNIWLDGSIYNGYPRASGASWDDHNICFSLLV